MIALGYGVISPAMPSFARTFGVSIEAVTFLVTVFSLSRLCFAPVSGLLVQRLGERRIYIGGLLVVRSTVTLRIGSQSSSKHCDQGSRFEENSLSTECAQTGGVKMKERLCWR